MEIKANLKLKGTLSLGRFTTTERDSLTNVENGMLLFNTTTNSVNEYKNSSWSSLANGGGDPVVGGVEFYGFNLVDETLELTTGDNSYNVSDFDAYFIGPSGITFSVNSNNDLIATF